MDDGVAGSDLTAWWPAAATRVAAGLRRRGVPAACVEDVLQETALRAWSARPAVSSVDELARWAFTVASRVWVDEQRRERTRTRRTAELSEAAERPDVDVLTEHVEAKLMLGRVARGLAALSERDRGLLLAGLADDGVATEPARRDQVRTAVQRHRARARLAAIMARLGAAAAVGRAVLRQARKAFAVSVAATCLLALTIPLVRPHSAPEDGGIGPSPRTQPIEPANSRSSAAGPSAPVALAHPGGGTERARTAVVSPPPREDASPGPRVVTVALPGSGPLNRPAQPGAEPDAAVCVAGVNVDGEVAGVDAGGVVVDARETAGVPRDTGCVDVRFG